MTKTVWGIGVNDCDHPVMVKGVLLKTYQVWRGMLERCYSPACHTKHPTYKGCTVVDQWLKFSIFETWMLGKVWKGMHLDKDLLYPGNKIYGPDTCVFVPRALNMLLTDRAAVRGPYPLGVTTTYREGGYQARIRTGKGSKHLGVFDTPAAAHGAWQKAKAELILAFPVNDDRVRAALDSRAEKLNHDRAAGAITNSLNH